MNGSRFNVAAITFDLLDPIPYGFFVGALIFDLIYSESAEVLWVKSASWMISIGLLFAVIPRLINLSRVWFSKGRRRGGTDIAAFWTYLLAIAAAIANAFAHSRDAYGVMPDGLWLSCVTVALIIVTKVVATLRISSVTVHP